MPYDAKQLDSLVEAMIENPGDLNEKFLDKLLDDFQYDKQQRTFRPHEDEEAIDLSTFGFKLSAKSSVPRFVGIKFCENCRNMLAPYEDRQSRRLIYKCRSCPEGVPGAQEPADNNCIYVSRAVQHIDALAQINQDVADDPTLPHHNKICPKCGGEDAVYFQAQANREQSNMKLYFVCCACGHKWQDDVQGAGTGDS
eukprot:TRINITY_DN8010_c0_g2_i1.p1 TRINITY_DN8010_c0_g2~~TRINITY_DN8010_c0_g2_i1.p1  ORF type:complete len:226 (+),score=26.57 TRINITY_DN8010_c0_g2_i1:88-678(+)